MAVGVGGVMRAEGALDLERPLQALFGGLYFPIPKELSRFLVPSGVEEIRWICIANGWTCVPGSCGKPKRQRERRPFFRERRETVPVVGDFIPIRRR